MAQDGNIIGFKDLDKSKLSNNLADKILVFMIRGCRKKFKQLVTFYLSSSRMTSVLLSEIIQNVIEALLDYCDTG